MFIMFLHEVIPLFFLAASILDHAHCKLVPCNAIASQSQICKVNELDYDKSFPAAPNPNHFFDVIEIYDVVELDSEDQSITLFLQLTMAWNDTRISSKSNK